MGRLSWSVAQLVSQRSNNWSRNSSTVKKPSKGINTDEAVAYGATVQAGVLSGEDDTDGLVLLDLCPLTIGIETVGDVMSKIIPRNSVVPAKKSQIFSTAADNQQTVSIQIYEGEQP